MGSEGASQGCNPGESKFDIKQKHSNPPTCSHTYLLSCQPGSFAISEGERIPLAGVKRKARQSIGPPSTAKVVKLKDFSRVVKSRFGELLLKSQGVLSEDTVEELKLWGTHYHVGLRETDDFLSYYSERKVCKEFSSYQAQRGLIVIQFPCRERTWCSRMPKKSWTCRRWLGDPVRNMERKPETSPTVKAVI